MSAARALPVEVPEVPWRDFWPKFCRAYVSSANDAHNVTILGPTGTGKSTIAMQVASRRHYVAALCVKPKDKPMAAMLADGRYRKALALPPPGIPRVYVWPKMVGIASEPEQRRVFAGVMDDAFRAGVWHLVIDEASYFVDPLRLDGRLKSWLRLGRSNGNALILCAQRPAWLPRDIYSAARHLFLFGTNDEADLRSIAGLNGVNNRTVRDTVAGLGRSHRVLYVDTNTGAMCVTRYERTNP